MLGRSAERALRLLSACKENEQKLEDIFVNTATAAEQLAPIMRAVSELQACNEGITAMMRDFSDALKKVYTRIDALESRVDTLKSEVAELKHHQGVQDLAIAELKQQQDVQDTSARYRCYINRFCKKLSEDIGSTWPDVADALSEEAEREEDDRPVTRKFERALDAEGVSWDEWQDVCCIAQNSNSTIHTGKEVPVKEALRQLRAGEVEFPQALADKLPALQKVLVILQQRGRQRR
ncbi:hypothetical protein JKP88DRAFT_242810 [Tribonema minus]|uniref:Uncharacterized protein n=1 Tax=Tribonema minus TaxID=303371 RepID=A0A835ZCP8_9STRA|nr:hypothetical protein JKP88DRAFT_242810 [Tribonema minus]